MNSEAAREFVMETIRNLDYVVTRKILKKFIKSEENDYYGNESISSDANRDGC